MTSLIDRADSSNSIEDHFNLRYKAVRANSDSAVAYRTFSNYERPLTKQSKYNCRLLAIILAILIIPSQILLRKTLRTIENEMIIKL